ncbi:MAG: hypothetical protein ACRD8U_11945 [Pyrinomonadaceae bacterium]
MKQSSSIRRTQELIAGMLGVRREGIARADAYLQHFGIIDYSRGHISKFLIAPGWKSGLRMLRRGQKKVDRLLG